VLLRLTLTKKTKMATTSTVYYPTEPIITGSQSADPRICSYEERTLVDPGVLKANCSPVTSSSDIDSFLQSKGYTPGTPAYDAAVSALENIDRCVIQSVHPVRAAIVPVMCKDQNVQVINRVEVQRDANGQKIVPFVTVYGTERPLPVDSKAPMYEYDPAKKGGAHGKKVPLYQTGGLALACGFPSVVDPRTGQISATCQRKAGYSGRCAMHHNAELSTGGGYGYAPQQPQQQANELLYHQYDPAWTTQQQSYPPAPHVGGGSSYGTDGNIVSTSVQPANYGMFSEAPPSALSGGDAAERELAMSVNRQASRLTREELTERFLGIPRGMYQANADEQKILGEYIAYRNQKGTDGKSVDEKLGLVSYVYNAEYGSGEGRNRLEGFDFDDQYLP
jgi:hypothetical protein